MPKFRKRPVFIEAVKYTGTPEDVDILEEWSSQKVVCGNLEDGSLDYSILYIETERGAINAFVGDWIIKGVSGQFYPCKPEDFDIIYEPA